MEQHIQNIVDYLIKDGDPYIDHDGWYSTYSWTVNRDGYNLSFEIAVTKLEGKPDRITQRLFLTDSKANTVYYTIADTHGYVGNPDEFMAKLKHSGVLDGCC